MKIVLLLFIGAATMLVTAGCESGEHEYHEHQGGAYDSTYGTYGHEQWPGYPARQGYWDRSDDWHPH